MMMSEVWEVVLLTTAPSDPIPFDASIRIHRVSIPTVPLAPHWCPSYDDEAV